MTDTNSEDNIAIPDLELPKKKVGRPRYDIIVPEGTNRKNRVNVEYMKKRYWSDPHFQAKCRERGRMYYYKRKEKLAQGVNENIIQNQ
jgi:hypothetical protein